MTKHKCKGLEELSKVSGYTGFTIENSEGIWMLVNKEDDYYSPYIIYCPYCGVRLPRVY